jgi:transcriptional/translational regulatory protein YebC/TACO1
MYFNKYGGALGTSGSVGFMFEHKCVFKFKPTEGADFEEMELEMIDFGVDEFYAEDGEVTVYASYESFGQIQTWIEEKGYELVSGESVRIPTDTKELTAEQREAVNKLIEHLEEDDDVTNVYTTMAESEDEAEDEATEVGAYVALGSLLEGIQREVTAVNGQKHGYEDVTDGGDEIGPQVPLKNG